MNVTQNPTELTVVLEIGPEFLMQEVSGEVKGKAEDSCREPARDEDTGENTTVPHELHSSVRASILLNPHNNLLIQLNIMKNHKIINS